MACRINAQRIWCFRLELEARMHLASTVVTLTYSDAPASLVPRDLTLWLKRLRKQLEPATVRYFAVGEYGTATARPHYHAILFGLPLSPKHDPLRAAGCKCSTCELVRSTWGKGHVLCDAFSLGAARYITGYVTKKMTKRSDPRLHGRHPEFTRMSRRPGIGARAVPDILSTVRELQAKAGLLNLVDVPTALRSGGSMKPLGRFLVQKLRIADGRDPKTPPLVLEERARKLQELSQAQGTAAAYVLEAEASNQAAAKLTRKASIFKPKESL